VLLISSLIFVNHPGKVLSCLQHIDRCSLTSENNHSKAS
jgi:hypothetical protein